MFVYVLGEKVARVRGTGEGWGGVEGLWYLVFSHTYTCPSTLLPSPQCKYNAFPCMHSHVCVPMAGGYSYRLCPADSPLTEECFQKIPLAFDRTAQMLTWNNGSLTWPMKNKGVFVDEGTYPTGRMWWVCALLVMLCALCALCAVFRLEMLTSSTPPTPPITPLSH